MRSVPPRGSGWVSDWVVGPIDQGLHEIYEACGIHPLPRGGPDLMPLGIDDSTRTYMEDLASIERRALRIKLLLMDCDGVLTDGRLWLLESGEEQKTFHTHDGLGLSLLHRAGLKSGIITGRSSQSVVRRAAELGVEFVQQGDAEKTEAFEQVMKLAGVDENEVAFIGDDLPDIPLMQRSELAVAVADARPETISVAHYVTVATGGRGAVREVVELILKSQGRWNELVEHYLKP